jgi:hypothetical protein
MAESGFPGKITTDRTEEFFFYQPVVLETK